jgi:hypothetical protein
MRIHESFSFGSIASHPNEEALDEELAVEASGKWSFDVSPTMLFNRRTLSLHGSN